jgi:beta-lactamase class A
LAGLLLMLGSPAIAQTTPTAGYKTRAESLVGLFGGKAKPEAIFSPAFLSQVPAAQINAISQQLGAQLGKPQAVARIETASATSGTVVIDFERGTLTARMVTAAAAPHLIEGLLITGTEVKGDSFTALAEEFKKLPGETSFAAARLGESAPTIVAAHESARPLAIGSTFKLFILAELDRSVQAGERKWTDVAKLDRRSLPSGFLQTWPQGSPMTLYSLAALMISQSDNTATDTLLHLLGRERVEAMVATAGVKAPERNRPFLSTFEAFAIKAGSGEASNGWAAADEAKRRALLATLAGLSPATIDLSKLSGAPNRIDTVEWFASAEDLIRTMDWLRRNAGQEAKEIMAINPGIGPGAAEKVAYLGYKGGSEVGVMNMTFLVQSKAGAWYAVSGGWNNKSAAVDEGKFVGLMSRAVALVR